MFQNKSSSCAHLSRQHQSCSMLPTIHEEVDMNISNELYPRDNLHDTDDDADEILSLPITQDTKDLYLKNLALSYLKGQSKYLLPASTIQHSWAHYGRIARCSSLTRRDISNLFFGINLSLSRNKMLILPETKLGKLERLVDLLLTILSYLFSVIPDVTSVGNICILIGTSAIYISPATITATYSITQSSSELGSRVCDSVGKDVSPQSNVVPGAECAATSICKAGDASSNHR